MEHVICKNGCFYLWQKQKQDRAGIETGEYLSKKKKQTRRFCALYTSNNQLLEVITYNIWKAFPLIFMWNRFQLSFPSQNAVFQVPFYWIIQNHFHQQWIKFWWQKTFRFKGPQEVMGKKNYISVRIARASKSCWNITYVN